MEACLDLFNLRLLLFIVHVALFMTVVYDLYA